MYYNIYEINTFPIKKSLMDAFSIGEHTAFVSRCAVVEDLEDKERTKALQMFAKWLKKEGLGELRNSKFILNDDVNCGKHFADRYAGFHKLAEVLSVMTEDDYLHRYHDVRTLASDLMKTIVDTDDDYVLLDGTLLSMDEFLRRAMPGQTYYIRNICKYHN